MKYFFALLAYRLVIIILLPILVLLLLLRSRKTPQYRQRLLERFGFIKQKMTKGGLVIHAASVGEVLALKPFIERLLKSKPEQVITLTTFTPTGSAQVTASFGQRVQHCYLPVDNIISTSLFLAKLKPNALVFMETELWPNLIHQAKNQKIPLLLINGRLTARSVKQYQKFIWLITPTLNCFDQLLIQSQSNLQHFLTLGVNKNRCQISGNLKYDIAITDVMTSKKHELQQYLPNNRLIWVFASTHPGDDEIAVNTFKKLRLAFPQLLLVLVPRHPERFESIYQFCRSEGVSVVKRSERKDVAKNEIWLLDSLGELMPMYALADIVTMGGSFSNVGGHNPLEPALFKRPIIVGPNMNNFTEVMTNLLNQQGIIQLDNNSDVTVQLLEKVTSLLQDKASSETLGQHAFQVITQNQGATEKSINVLEHLSP